MINAITGYIVFISESGGGFDANGNTTSSTKVKSIDIPCNLKRISKEYTQVINGQRVISSYVAYVAKDKLLSINPLNYLQIELKGIESNSLGVFQIQSAEFLHFAKEYKIVV